MTLQGKVNQALEKLGYDRKTIEDPGKLAALAKKSDSKTEALVRWVKKNLFSKRQAPGRRAADRLHRVQGDAVLPGAAASSRKASTRTRCGCSTAA